MKSRVMLLLSAVLCLAFISVFNPAPVNAVPCIQLVNTGEKGLIWHQNVDNETAICQVTPPSPGIELPKQQLSTSESIKVSKPGAWGNSKGRQGCDTIKWGSSSCGSGCKAGFGASTCDIQPK
jgi:hypothetical protein